MLNYGSNSNLILFFSGYSTKSLNNRKRKLKILLDFPNYFFTVNQLKEWIIDTKFIKRDKELNFPIRDFIKGIKEFKPNIILLTTPNNPTGKPIKDAELIEIIKSTPKNMIILLDRSCVNVLPEISTKELFLMFKNKKLTVLHSFSKSHSLSEERIGYLATNNKEIADFLYNKRDLDHNNNALKRLMETIDNKMLIQNKINMIKECHIILRNNFANKKSRYLESYSNFALIKLASNLNSKIVEEYFKRRGILLMGGHKIGLGNKYIRIHMSGVSEIKKFIQEFNRLEK